MKYQYYLLLVLSLLLSFTAMAQSVGVGTTAPAASAALDVTSTTGGMLLPRMTTTQRAAIPNPVQGLFVFQTDGTPGLYYYIGNSWVNVVNGLIPDRDGNAGANPATRVSTLAGGPAGYADGTCAAAQFNGPSGVAVDLNGNVYVADSFNNCIRIITVRGMVSTLAGSGVAGINDGTGTSAYFNNPTGVALDGSGNVYVADKGNNCIRKIDSGKHVTTLAGNGRRGFGGYADGTGTSAQFNGPSGVAADLSGNVYVADQGNNCIRKIMALGEVSTLAGSVTAGYADGQSAAAQFNRPSGVALFSRNTVNGNVNGNLYVADQGNNRIRRISPLGGYVGTLAGNGGGVYADGIYTDASFNNPIGVAVDGSGNVYVADQGNNRIRKITPVGVVSTLAGSGTQGGINGTGASAQFNGPSGVAVDGSGTVYVADFGNQRIQVVK